jgi:hypothetical protein
MTPQQAIACVAALDLFSRIGTGQLEEIVALIRQGVVPVAVEAGGRRQIASLSDYDGIEGAIAAVKGILGYRRGSSLPISHQHVCVEARRCYELMKVLDRSVAEWRDPNPGFRGVSYDGLGPRYTTDPAPSASMTGDAP